ncbi:MAG: Trk system potassium transporter TrkA [Planctomycetota bacterium]
MDIIICGAGEVGSHVAEVLSGSGHSITVIDTNAERLRALSEALDIATLTGNAAEAPILLKAGAGRCDVFIAATDQDEINLLCASVARGLGANKVIARIHHATYLGDTDSEFEYQKHFGIDRLICPEDSTATAIARTLRNPAALAIEHFSRGRIDMQEFVVGDEAPALGKPLSSVKLPTGSRVAAVNRKGDVFIPGADTEIEATDKLVLVANHDVFSEARSRLHKVQKAGRSKVVLMGAPPMATWLCRALRDREWSIRVFETNRQRAEQLAETLPWVTVINADPTDPSVFAEEQIGAADVFIALLDEDEVNIIGCVQAKANGVTQAIAVVHKSKYLDLLYHVGVDRPFSPSRVAAREIEDLLDDNPVRLLATLINGVDAHLARVTSDAEVCGKPLKEIKLTPNWVIAAIRRKSEVWVPGADDTIEVNDTVLVIGRQGRERKLRTLFAGSTA